MMAGERRPESSNPHTIQTEGSGDPGGPSLFTCPRCRRQFHRSFLERFWSEWSRICAAVDGSRYRSDCALARDAGKQVPGPAGPEPSGHEAGLAPNSEIKPEIVGACVGDCAYCGDHNRLAVVTSQQVVSRCLRCRDEAILTEPPPWCRLRHSASGQQLGEGELSQSDSPTGQPDAGHHTRQ